MFMTTVGRMGDERRRFLLPPSITFLGAKAEFEKASGRTVEQPLVVDENDFVLSDELLQKPLSTLSNGCRLAVCVLSHEHPGS